MKKILSYAGLLLLVAFAIFGSAPAAHAQGVPDVVINEFNLTEGGQWLEIINTTASDINLASSTWQLVTTVEGPGAGTTTLSGLLPAYGLLTFTPNTLATSTFHTLLTLKNNGTPIYAMSYGSSTPFSTEQVLEAFPSSSESAVLTGSAPGSWSATSTLSRGWFNETIDPIPDCDNPPVPGVGLPVTLNAIATCLFSTQGVTTNMGSTTLIADPTVATGLYFEKANRGKITYTGSLNLTDQNNRVLLQAMGSKLKVNTTGRMGLNAASSTIMKNLGAAISIYGLSTLGYDSSLGSSSLSVLDDDGLPISTSSPDFPAISGVSWDAGNNGTLIFDASHFTEFGPNPVLSEVTPITTPTASTSPYYTFSSNVAGTAVYGGACAMTSASTTVGNNRIQFGPLTPATYSNCTIKVIDGAGASSTLAVSSFILVDTAADLAAVTADKASLVESMIKGANADLSNITVALTNPLPSTGTASSSAITWASASTTLISNDGQTVNRPVYGDGNATTTLTATITKNLTSTTTVFNLIVLQTPASTIATVTSGSYTVNDGAGTITDVTYGVASSTFLGNLTKGQVNQTWNISGISNPVVTGNTLVVTAQDASTTKTYTITTLPNPTDVTAVATDKAALIAASSTLLATNSAWTNITAALSALPATGTASSSAITWASASTTLVSNNGQTVNRPAYGSSNATTTLTATITSGAASDTFVISLTVLASLNPAKAITGFTITNQVGSTTINETEHTITVVMPNGTNVTALVPTVTITGASVSPISGTSTNFTSTTTYTVTASDAGTQAYIVTVQVLSATQTAPDGTGAATISTTTPEVVITDPTATTTLTINSGVTNPTIDVSAFIGNMGTGTIPAIVIDSPVADVTIPASTLVTSASTTWDGVIAAPTVTTVNLPTTAGYTKTLSAAIEVGFSGIELTFDKGVRILLPGQAGKLVGYTRDGGATLTQITATCAADNQATGDALSAGADCKIDVSGDLVIWTKHFTSFASYSQVAESTGGHVSGSVATTPVTAPILQLISAPITIVSVNTFTNDLKLGSSGTEVVELQKVLVAKGLLVMPAGVQMGYYGTLTQKAVMAYQLNKGLPQVGVVGPMTREKLNNEGGVSVKNFINLLITLGIIAPDKLELVRSIIPGL